MPTPVVAGAAAKCVCPSITAGSWNQLRVALLSVASTRLPATCEGGYSSTSWLFLNAIFSVVVCPSVIVTRGATSSRVPALTTTL
jgi:hypothetical protein